MSFIGLSLGQYGRSQKLKLYPIRISYEVKKERNGVYRKENKEGRTHFLRPQKKEKWMVLLLNFRLKNSAKSKPLKMKCFARDSGVQTLLITKLGTVLLNC